MSKEIDLFSELLVFTGLMRKEMNANEHKGKVEDWITKESKSLLFDMLYHAAKLAAALREEDDEKVKEFSADCANLAFMTMLAYQNRTKLENKRFSGSGKDSDSDCGHWAHEAMESSH